MKYSIFTNVSALRLNGMRSNAHVWGPETRVTVEGTVEGTNPDNRAEMKLCPPIPLCDLDTFRQQIVPSTKAWHIDRIMAALDDFIACQNAVVNRTKNTLIE